MKNNDTKTQETSSMPILDLDKLEQDTDLNYDEMIKSEEYLMPEPDEEPKSPPENKIINAFLKINWHVILLIILVFSVIFIIYRLKNWGVRLDIGDLDQSNITEENAVEVLDSILPNLKSEGHPSTTDGVTNILLFGNGAFAEDYGTVDNVGNLIAEMADANVYNCSVPGSYLAATNATFSAYADPMDAFNFYWLSTFVSMDNAQPCEQAIADSPDRLPPEAWDVYEILKDMDFSTIDVIGIMYDASDYLTGRTIYNPEKPIDIQTFYGNLLAGIQAIQEAYPHIRIIVMSPTYAYAVNSKGEYVDSDIYVYNEYTLSTYSQMLAQATDETGVTYVDNFYGTVNIYNANKYLIDNVHLNKDGKQLLAERFVYALQYYD